MEKYKIIFLISDNNKWSRLFAHIENLLLQSHMIDSIEVVVTDTAILSTLRQNSLANTALTILRLHERKVAFWLCGNTLHKFNFPAESIMPEIKIAPEGGIIKVVERQAMGYNLFTL